MNSIFVKDLQGKWLLVLICFVLLVRPLQGQDPFITTWTTTNVGPGSNDQVTIPTTGSGYNYSVDWGDGSSSTNITGNISHTYSSPGTYTVSINGDFPKPYFGIINPKKLASIEQWGDIAWTSMANGFSGCTNLVINATDTPNLSGVTDMWRMFYNAESLTGGLSHWDVSNVTRMELMFTYANSFNEDLNLWDVSAVTNMKDMFREASAFDGNISSWDVSSVSNMQDMFSNTDSFNGDLSNWDVSSVTNMKNMFRRATSFNGDLSAWNVTSVTTLQQMFLMAQSFVGNIGNWDVSNVTDFSGMFASAASFDGNVNTWDISGASNLNGMLDRTELDVSKYEAILSAWSQLSQIPQNLTLGAYDLKYCDTTYRDILVNTHGWTITGDDYYCSVPFITTWDTRDLGSSGPMSIQLPASGTGFDYTVDWGDGSSDSSVTSSITHTYSTPGVYTVSIEGDFPRLSFYGNLDGMKLRSIDQWGSLRWEQLSYAFYNCRRMKISATDSPDLSRVTSTRYMFYYTDSLTGDFSNWDVSNITSMSYMFSRSAINEDLSSWDVSNVLGMNHMFDRASNFNVNISSWDVSQVYNMSNMFEYATQFDQNLGDWNVSSVTNMSSMLDHSALSLDKYDSTLQGWSSLPGLQQNVPLGASGLLYCDSQADRSFLINNKGWQITGDAIDLSCPGAFVTTWNTANPGSTSNNRIRIPTTGSGYNYSVYWGDGTSSTNVTGSITHAYASPGIYTVSILGDFPRIYFLTRGTDPEKLLSIEEWGNIQWQSMEGAFYNCSNLVVNATDSPDLSNVTSTASMFRGASSLTGDFSNWDVSGISQMNSMFNRASSFNSDLSSWDVGNVASMSAMFFGASSFNSDLSSWDVTSVTSMSSVFLQATSFDHNLGMWDVSSASSMYDMLSESGVSRSNYDSTLIGWASLSTLQNGVYLGADNLAYCLGDSARLKLINDFGWQITGDQLDPSCRFVTTWDTSKPGISGNNQITIPTLGTGYNYSVDWGDGTSSTNVTGDITHSYTNSGVYTVSILGSFPRILFNNYGDKEKILSVEQWGILEWESMDRAFFGCKNLIVTATDNPDLSNVTSMRMMFQGDTSLVDGLANWDISNVTNMNSVFLDATSFNSDLSGWDVSSVTDMWGMFYFATSFNSNLNSWDVSGVTDMTAMFHSASSFNSDLSSWDVSGATTMPTMFHGATSFNSDLSAWDVSNVNNTYGMFLNATSFNSDLSSWDVSSVNDMSKMFSSASAFNSDLSDWDVSQVTDMKDMFKSAISFNSDLSDWIISNVTDMTGVFSYSALSSANYDSLLLAWSQLTVQPNITMGAHLLTYCYGDSARQHLIDSAGWSFAGDILAGSCGQGGSRLLAGDDGASVNQALFVNETSGVLLYPNPTYNILNIRMPGDKIRNLKLFNLNGLLLDQQEYSNTINLSNRRPGIYILMVADETGNSSYHKVFKRE